MSISGLVIILAIFLGIGFLVRKSAQENAQLEKSFNETRMVADPEELIKMGYRPLINILNKSTSMMDPRPGAVVREFKIKGYDLVICPLAYDRYGNRSYICSSLWGKYSLRLV